jgi:glucokinase
MAAHLFQFFRDGAPHTRADIQLVSGLARSTVAARIDELLASGLIRPVAEGASTGGRPPSRFAMDPSARLVAAADLGAAHATLAIADLHGSPLAERRASLAISEGPSRVLGWLVDALAGLLADLGRSPADLAAIGIGLPGPVEFSTGRPVNPPIMPGWDLFDVSGWIRGRIDVPVLVDNDVNISALGELKVAWPDTRHLMFVKIATGIGSGIISEGRLQRGARGSAGDIGHVEVPGGPDVPCTCGNTGCLEALASGSALAAALGVAGGSDVVELVKAGDTDAIQAVRQAGRDIGRVLATAVSLLNPRAIVLGGSMARVGEHLIAGVREAVYTRSMPLATEQLTITASTAGSQAAVLGAAVLAAEHALSPEVLASLL